MQSIGSTGGGSATRLPPIRNSRPEDAALQLFRRRRRRAAPPTDPPRVAAAAASSSPSSSQNAPAAKQQLFTCRRCFRRVSAADNHASACRYHPALYSGGEVAKAIGFVRASAAAEDQLKAVTGRQGLMRFWDCCGDEDAEAPGCEAGHHLGFDDEENARRGWK